MIPINGNRLGSLIALLCASAFSAAAVSPEYPKAELFGGYQFTRIGGAGGVNANGWNAAMTGNVNRRFGLTADFSGACKGIGKVRAKAHTYTFGPTLSFRSGLVTAS